MFSFRYLVLAAATILATAAQRYTSPRFLELEDIVNNTVCAIHVRISEDLNRIPEQIQEIKCARPPDQWCIQNGFAPVECCHGSQDRHLMECVEVTNKVMVNYKDREETSWLDVPIGCVCFMSKVTVIEGLTQS